MKKLLLLLLLPLSLFGQPAQTPIRDEYFTYTGSPTFVAKTIGAISVDVTNRVVYTSTSNQYVRWVKVTDAKIIERYLPATSGTGTNGKDATITINSVNTITGAAGTQASVQITDVNPNASDAAFKFDFTIPTGYTGATGANGVCPQCPPSGGGSFPFTVVVGSGGDDRAALQAAINKNATDRIPVYLIGNIKLSGEITIGKNNLRLTIFAYGADVRSTNTNTFTWFRRVTPVDQSEALNSHINAKFIVYGGDYWGLGNQSLFDLGPSTDSRYQDINAENFNQVVRLKFALATTLENISATGCLNPFHIGIGDWPGADNANSQSNHTTANHLDIYMPSNGQMPIYVFASSGTSVTNTIIEGFVATDGIFFDSNNSNVVRDATIENVHFECVNGATGAFIKMKYAAGTLTINKVYGQYPALLLDISAGEFTTVEISNIPWFRVKNGKLIKRTGDVQIFLERVIVEGPTHINGSNVMSFVDNGTTVYRTPYYFEDPTGKLKINNQR